MPDLKNKIFFLKRKIYHRQSIPFFRELLANQQLSFEKLDELNWERCKRIVEFAWNNIPFYQKKYAEVGFSPGDLRDRIDYSRLPILEKEEIRESAESMISPRADSRKLKVATTGGSTGVPLKVFLDPAVPLQPISWRTLGWWGVHPADNSAYLYRNVPFGMKRLVQQVLLFPTRRAFIFPLDMIPDRLESFYRTLLRLQPKYLIGYVGSIDVLVRFLEKRKASLPGLSAVWTTSSPLPEIKRRYFADVLKAPVYTQYGSCEFYWIAAECNRQSGMHIVSDVRNVEVVQGNNMVAAGEYGDIVVTDLTNYAFPLIRYRLGDRGRLLPERCKCGMPFPMMDYVRGRISDLIKLPGGGAIPGEFWTTIFDDFTGIIRAFQIHQQRDYSIIVRFEPYGEKYKEAIAKVGEDLRCRTGRTVLITFQRSVIDEHDLGKTRFVVSDLK